MFKEGTTESLNNNVVIEGINSDAFELFLEYLNTRRATIVDGLVADLYAIADKYNVLSLREICITHMSNNVTIDNACELLGLAVLHSVHQIKPVVLEFIKDHFVDVAVTDGWASLLKNYPLAVKEHPTNEK